MRGLVLCGLLLLITMAAIRGVREVAGRDGVPLAVTALLPDEGCKAPCWEGIRPDVATAREAGLLLAGDSSWTKSSTGGWQRPLPGGTVMLAQLEDGRLTVLPEGVRLGDLLAVLGKPDYQVLNFVVMARTLSSDRYLQLYFETPQLYLEVAVPPGKRLHPRMAVSRVVYASLRRPAYSQPWSGFVWLPETPTFP